MSYLLFMTDNCPNTQLFTVDTDFIALGHNNNAWNVVWDVSVIS